MANNQDPYALCPVCGKAKFRCTCTPEQLAAANVQQPQQQNKSWLFKPMKDLMPAGQQKQEQQKPVHVEYQNQQGQKVEQPKAVPPMQVVEVMHSGIFKKPKTFTPCAIGIAVKNDGGLCFECLTHGGTLMGTIRPQCEQAVNNAMNLLNEMLHVYIGQKQGEQDRRS